MGKLPNIIKPANKGGHVIQNLQKKMDDLCMDAIKFLTRHAYTNMYFKYYTTVAHYF